MKKLFKKSIHNKKIFEKETLKPKNIILSPTPGSAKECMALWLSEKYNQLLFIVPDDGIMDKVGLNLKAYAAFSQFKGEIIPAGYCGYNTSRFDKALCNLKRKALRLLTTRMPVIVVSSVLGVQEKIPFSEEGLCLKIMSRYDREELIRWLFENGYERVNYVEQPGEYAVRGGVLDVHGFGVTAPVRMELYHDQIDLMREFDPVSQKTTNDISEVCIFKAGEHEKRLKGVVSFYPEENPILFFNEEALLDLDFRKIVCMENEFTGPEIMELEGEEKNTVKEFFHSNGTNEYIYTGFSVLDFTGRPLQDRLEILLTWKESHPDYELWVSCSTEGDLHRLKGMTEERLLNVEKVHFVVSALSEGFVLPLDRFVVVTDSELFSRYQTRNLGFRYGRGGLSAPVRAFEPGDTVVHFAHGIGIYRGVSQMEVDGVLQEVMVVEYADEAKLFVPRDHYYLMEKYVGTSATVPSLDRLGSNRWRNKKADAYLAIQDYAAKILKVESERELKKGEVYEVEGDLLFDFENSFPYQETPDQERAIEEVKRDLHSEKPMNRLILGDAGFGKTEVAIRAAFIATMAGKQTAVLVPTTILAEQHYKTFLERMAEYPVRIEVLSRFTSGKKQKEVLTDLKHGKVDVLIGTHRIVQKDVLFPALGLLIIDEEQRFGVGHKDYLVRKYPLVNILNLSATPIPRTLYLSLMGARNMSAIMTAPVERRPIETKIIQEDWSVVKVAIEEELKRKGQVFFVHNRIHSIQQVYNKLQSFLPEVRFAIGHGQLPEHQLKAIMEMFENKEIDCLIATNIIESGLDMPNVNTLIIHHAEKFGLAELYQLRGRVGRFNRKAYAYLMISPGRNLDDHVKKRLKAIHEFSKPGGGYQVALKDLEIRGAGNILGIEQSGHIAAIGFDLYCKLLRDAIKSLKGEEITPKYEVVLILGETGGIPDSYVPDFQDRFLYYKKMASAEKLSEIDEIQKELKDKFGRLPSTVLILLDSFRLKCFCRQKRILKIEQLGQYIEIIEKGHNIQRTKTGNVRDNIFSHVLNLLMKS